MIHSPSSLVHKGKIWPGTDAILKFYKGKKKAKQHKKVRRITLAWAPDRLKGHN